MNGQNSSWEAALQETAASFPYPPTPDLVPAVRQRLMSPRPRRARTQWAYAAALLLLAAAVLLAAPPVRAALVAFFRAGAITIFIGEPTSTLASTQVPPMTPPPLLETALGVRVTLAEAQAQAGFPLRLPLEYGAPDEVYMQPLPDPGLAGQVVIMVWRDPAQTSLPEQPRLRLYQIGAEEYGLKQAAMQAVREAWVHGQNAFWVEGGHVIQLPAGPYLVEQDVLIWTGGSVTYRLESGLSLAEAVQLAESLREIAPACPVTRPPAIPFMPPPPWPAQPPTPGQFWYGDDGLWTALPADGNWRQLALGEKFWWWSAAFDVAEDATPALTVTARRLDGDAPVFQASPATNGYHESFHWAMLMGVQLASPGCWEVTGQYKDSQLSFVLWVPSE